MSLTPMTTINTDLGTEQFWNIECRLGGKVFSYGFVRPDGKLFRCVETTLETCRERRDRWLANDGIHEGKHYKELAL